MLNYIFKHILLENLRHLNLHFPHPLISKDSKLSKKRLGGYRDDLTKFYRNFINKLEIDMVTYIF